MLLSDVLGTPLLATRAPSLAKQRRRAIRGAWGQLEHRSVAELAEEARHRCGAQSAGVSLFRRADPVASEWVVASGNLSSFQGSKFPLRHSLCGVAAELRSTQLFIKPQRYFKWIEHAGVYISEALVTPLSDGGGRRFGTLWVMSHRGARPNFDESDAKALEAIAGVLAIALRQLAAEPSSIGVARDRSNEIGII